MQSVFSIGKWTKIGAESCLPYSWKQPCLNSYGSFGSLFLGKGSKYSDLLQIVSQRPLYQDIFLRGQSSQGELLVQINQVILYSALV